MEINSNCLIYKGGNAKCQAERGQNSTHRASKKAAEKAASLGLSIPIWKDGKIIFIEAKEKLKKLGIA